MQASLGLLAHTYHHRACRELPLFCHCINPSASSLEMVTLTDNLKPVPALYGRFSFVNGSEN
jgi:hypothetical protein